MSPVFRCIWHSFPAHRAFQANISIVKNETETCISSDLTHFNELTKVYLLAVCKAHILNSSLQKCQTASFFLSQALSNDQTKWVQLCWGHKPPHTFTAWLDRCRFRYLPLNQEKAQNFPVLWVRLHQFWAPLELPPAVIAHLEYSATAISFPPPWFTWDLSPKAILTSAGEELQESEPATLTRLHYSPCLNSHLGHHREMLLLREKLHSGHLLFQGHFIHPSLRALK